MIDALPRKHLTILLAIVAGGFILRLIGSDRSLWGDEFFSLYWAERGLHFLWTDGFVQETNPPLYYTFILGWIKLFGTSELSLRMPGILASVATILLVYLMGTRLFNLRTGLIAAAFFAINPLQISLAIYARSYGPQTFLAGLCFYGALLFFSATKKRRGATIYFVGAVALAYTHYTQAFLLASFGITGAIFCRHDRRLLLYWFTVNLGVFVATLPEIRCMTIIYHNAPMSLLKVSMNYVPGNIELFLAGVEYSSAAAVLCALTGFAFYDIWQSSTLLARTVLIATPGLFVAILTIGNFWMVIFHEKSLIVLSIPVSIVLATMVDRIEGRNRVIMLAFIIALYAFCYPRGAEVTPYRAMFNSLPRPIDQNTYVVFGPHDQIAAIGYYRPDLAYDRIYLWNADDILPLYMDTAYWTKLFSVSPMNTQTLEQLIADHKHIYLLTNTAVYKVFKSRFARAPDHITGEGLVRLYEWQGTSQ